MIDLFLDNLLLILRADGDSRRVRDALLRLAVRGRLVAQDAGDEPAERLLRRLESDGHKGLDRRVAKMLAGLAPVDATNAPFALPEGWTWTRLGRLAEPKAGFAFKSNAFNTAGEGLPLIRIRDVSPGRSQTYYSGEYRDEFLVNDGDLLVGMDGRFCVAFWKGGTALLNQRVTRLDWYTDLVRPEFVCWAFGQRLADLQDVKSYTTVDHLSGGQIAATPIPIPPLPEQRRIVAKADELTEHAAALEQRHHAAATARVRLRDAALHALAEAEDAAAVEQAWQRIEEHFEDLFTEPEDIQPLRQTILQLAVRGRLVRQEEGDEPAERLMERLESDGHEGLDRRVAKMLAELTPVDATEATFALPVGWTWTRLGRIAEPKAGFAFKSNAFNTAGEGLPLIRIRDVSPGRSETYYSGEYRDEFVVNDGDLLVGMDGRFCVAFWKGGTALLNQRVTRLDWYTDLVLPEFVCWAFAQRLAGLQDVKSYTTVDHLSGGQIAATPIPIPPLAEQHRIVAKVDELMALCDTLEASLNRAKAGRERFAASISAALDADPTQSPDRDAA